MCPVRSSVLHLKKIKKLNLTSESTFSCYFGNPQTHTWGWAREQVLLWFWVCADGAPPGSSPISAPSTTSTRCSHPFPSPLLPPCPLSLSWNNVHSVVFCGMFRKCQAGRSVSRFSVAWLTFCWLCHREGKVTYPTATVDTAVSP